MTAPYPGVVLITGGSRGIGLGTALVMGRRGWAVAINGTDAGNLAKASAQLAAEGIRHHTLCFPVEELASWAPALDTVEATLGPITALFANAGISVKRNGRKVPFEDAELELWQKTMDVNLWGKYYPMKAVGDRMIARKIAGAMVATSSIAGMVGAPLTPPYYGVSNTAVVGLVRVSAHDLGKYGIRVNGIAPGRITTDMIAAFGAEFNRSILPQIALGREGSAEEVGEVVEFLLSPRASYISGETINVTGGWLMN